MGSGDTWSFETVEESSSSDDSVNQEPDYDPDEFLFPPVPVVAAPVAPPVVAPIPARGRRSTDGTTGGTTGATSGTSFTTGKRNQAKVYRQQLSG
ncbi:hypothetical protein Tsubulata_025200 [Turnera subulata]|uniref:Uncharacterized protein n=1 Tax=Turnera subulata TaxID=218843 RepID=A0A9Q0FIA6_9ROSI|nr:hypothetical protein Tsubulata_025200 [Turnera subulata]